VKSEPGHVISEWCSTFITDPPERTVEFQCETNVNAGAILVDQNNSLCGKMSAITALLSAILNVKFGLAGNLGFCI
jgi:hypothetical protein